MSTCVYRFEHFDIKYAKQSTWSYFTVNLFFAIILIRIISKDWKFSCCLRQLANDIGHVPRMDITRANFKYCRLFIHERVTTSLISNLCNPFNGSQSSVLLHSIVRQTEVEMNDQSEVNMKKESHYTDSDTTLEF